MCSLPYVTFEGLSPAEPVAAPVLIGKRYGGRPVYFSGVIVHCDSPYRSFLDLRGRSWAYNEVLSHSGYGIHPELRQAVRVVEAPGPSTIQPVAESMSLGDDLREAALVSLHEDLEVRAGLAESLVERFVPVGPKDYDDLRAMVAASEAAGFTRIL